MDLRASLYLAPIWHQLPIMEVGVADQTHWVGKGTGGLAPGREETLPSMLTLTLPEDPTELVRYGGVQGGVRGRSSYSSTPGYLHPRQILPLLQEGTV